MIRTGLLLTCVGMLCVSALCFSSALCAGETLQPVLLPQVDLLRRLDPAQEWLFLPLDEWRRLRAAGATVPARSRAGTGLLGGSVEIACSPHGCTATAQLIAVADVRSTAVVPLFAIRPQQFQAITVADRPGLLVGDAVLLPGSGRWPLRLSWSQPAPPDADAGWSLSLPLPLAAALDVVVTAPPDWEISGPGLVADGPGRWRLTSTTHQLVGELRPAGSRARAWGASQSLVVRMPEAGAGGTFTWAMGDHDGALPDPLHLRLPPGFTATVGGEPQPDGSVLLHPARGRLPAVEGIVAAGAAIDLPRFDGALWQGGVVSIATGEPTLLETPTGWLPVAEGALAGNGLRHYAVAAPGHALVPTALVRGNGCDVRAAAAVTVGTGLVRAAWVLEVRSAVPMHRVDVQVPAGWRVVAAEAAGAAGATIDLPPEDEVQAAGWPLAVVLAKAADCVLTVVLTLERPAGDNLPLAVPTIAGTVRSSARVLIVADPASEVSLAPPTGSWRLGPAVNGGGFDAVAELLAGDDAPALQLAVRPRTLRLDAQAACWLLPRGEDCLVRLDLRLAAAAGAVEGVDIVLPTALGDGWTVESGGAVLHDGRLTWAAAWTGERLVRLAARLPVAQGRSDAVRPRLQVAGLDVPLRLSVAALAGERVDVTAVPAGRTLEPDEMPRWSAPPPGTRVLAAWRPAATGETGSISAQQPRLHDGPGGFLDRVELRTQVAPGGVVTLFSARLAAPGLAALPLALPAGMTLELAQVDGEMAPVRRDGDGRCAVILPGRTLVQLALRFVQPVVPGDCSIALPEIALPWLSTAWTLAVAPAWRATPVVTAGAMPLNGGSLPPRRLFGGWRPAEAVRERPPVRVMTAAERPADPRLLGGAPVLPPRRTEAVPAVLDLTGPILAGQRIGAPSGLRLHLVSVSGLQSMDRIGRMLGLIGGCVLIALALRSAIRWWRCLAVAATAGIGAAALLAAQVAAGPLLGACEVLLLLAPFAAVLAWRRRSVEVRS